MGFRQIRWASVGRVATIVAAVIAGVLSLPALLGGDAPPPVPPDVGLTPSPVATAVPPPAQPTVPQRVPKPHHRKPPRPKLVKRTPARRHDHHHKSSPPDVAALPPVPTYVPSYAPPPRPGEFQFER
jgi:hypothetical protein